MATIPYNRASYQHVPNIHLGAPKRQILTHEQRMTVRQVQNRLNSALTATNDSFCDVTLTNAIRDLRAIMQSRLSNRK